METIRHRTESGLVSGVVRLHAGTLTCDLPYHEHVTRNGRFVLQMWRIELDVRLLAAILDALRKAEDHLHRMREAFLRAGSHLLAGADFLDEEGDANGQAAPGVDAEPG